MSQPLGLPKPLLSKQDPPTIEKIQLGKKLFFDKRLSRDENQSCASCHQPNQAFTENNKPTPTGFRGLKVRRNAPSLLNSRYYERLAQDGREISFETQYILPITAKNEMANPSIGFVIEKLNLLDEYPPLFFKTFGRGPSADTIGRALAAYQRTLISANSPFDRWHYAKQKNALSKKQIEGFKIFTEKAKCSSCHQIEDDYALFTDQAFHDIGYGWQQQQKSLKDKTIAKDLGRYEVTLNPLDKWRYRTPTLRNIALTAPYMHDGGLKTLKDVIEFYNKGGAPHEGQDQRIKELNLNKQEIEALIAFLKSLTGESVKE